MRDGMIVDTWCNLFRMGASALTEELAGRLLPNLDANTRALVKALLDQVAHDKKWIIERTHAMRAEAEHVATIGETMRRAGLRSYTDERGRIFVSATVTL